MICSVSYCSVYYSASSLFFFFSPSFSLSLSLSLSHSLFALGGVYLFAELWVFFPPFVTFYHIFRHIFLPFSEEKRKKRKNRVKSERKLGAQKAKQKTGPILRLCESESTEKKESSPTASQILEKGQY